MKTVAEFFKYSVNNILYQREIYPTESFKAEKVYGLSMFVTRDEGLAGYLDNVLQQIEGWLTTGNLQKLVLVITSQATGETLERWVFDLQTDKSIGPEERVDKDEKEIKAEIAAIQRQITASVTFLPLNDEPCAFDLLVYTDDDIQVRFDSVPRPAVPAPLVLRLSPALRVHATRARLPQVPKAWEESDPRLIVNSDEVKLRSFTTKVHKVDASVTYRADD